MNSLLCLIILLVAWVVLQYILYIIVYYKYEICKELRYEFFYKNSKFFCYTSGLLISMCSISLCFDNHYMINMLNNITISKNMSMHNLIILFSISAVLIIIIFLTESLFEASVKVDLEAIKNIEIKKKYVSTLDFITIVLIAPIIEEVIFRGGLYESMKLNFEVVTSVVIVGIVFGLVHIWPKKAIFSFISSIIFSIGYIFGGVYVSIICHIFYNILSTYKFGIKV